MAEATAPLAPTDAALAAVEIDSVPLIQWYESRGIARATAYRLLKVAGIEPQRVKLPGSRSPVSVLDRGMVEALDAVADRLRQGKSMAQLEAEAITALATTSSETVSDTEAVATPVDRAELRDRLELAQLAQATGLPLTTREVALLLGARPGAAEVTRGYVTARRWGRNCWTLERNSSPPSQSV